MGVGARRMLGCTLVFAAGGSARNASKAAIAASRVSEFLER